MNRQFSLLLSAIWMILSVVFVNGQQVVMKGPSECAGVSDEIEMLKQKGAEANDFCNAYVSLPTIYVTATETTSYLPPTATVTEYSTITPAPIISSETSIIEDTTTVTTTLSVDSIESPVALPTFLNDANPDAVASACSCIPLSQVTSTTTSTLTITLATPSTTTTTPVTLPATVSTITVSVTNIVTLTSTIARQVAAQESQTTETGSSVDPSQAASTSALLEAIASPIATFAPIKGAEAIQLVQNPSFADGESQWNLQTSGSANGYLTGGFGYDEDDTACLIYTNIYGPRRIPPSRAAFSQTLTLVPGRQYELSYFQGFTRYNDRQDDFFSEFAIFAQLNGVQVTPPAHPCGGKVPGTCVTLRKAYGPVYYEEVKAIVSSPMAETTLTIIFDSPTPFNLDDVINDSVTHLLDRVTMTAL